jgi:hypothetical protein
MLFTKGKRSINICSNRTDHVRDIYTDICESIYLNLYLYSWIYICLYYIDEYVEFICIYVYTYAFLLLFLFLYSQVCPQYHSLFLENNTDPTSTRHDSREIYSIPVPVTREA